MLLGLIVDQEEKFSSPFEFADNIKRGLIARAEEAGGSALSWDLTQFDKIGGCGTIRSVWAELKPDELISGKKRPLSDFISQDEDTKKRKISLT